MLPLRRSWNWSSTKQEGNWEILPVVKLLSCYVECFDVQWKRQVICRGNLVTPAPSQCEPPGIQFKAKQVQRFFYSNSLEKLLYFRSCTYYYYWLWEPLVSDHSNKVSDHSWYKTSCSNKSLVQLAPDLGELWCDGGKVKMKLGEDGQAICV